VNLQGNYSFDSFIVCAQPLTKSPLVTHTIAQVFRGQDFEINSGAGDGNTPDRFSIIIPPYLNYKINHLKCINVPDKDGAEPIIDVYSNEVAFASLRTSGYTR
jgi:hypothetical protein